MTSLWSKIKSLPRPAWAAGVGAVDGLLLLLGVPATIVAIAAAVEAVLIGVPVAVLHFTTKAPALGPVVHDPATKRLGRLPHVPDARDLKMVSYLTSKLPTPPAGDIDNSLLVKRWLMLLNDRLGDCTIAAALHMVMLWARQGGRSFTARNSEALAAYEHACGYNPRDPSTDQGGVERDVLTYWRAHGIGGHKIGAFLAINPKSATQRKIAVWLFGAVYLGVDLQTAQQHQTVWDYVPSGEWGGHAVPLVCAGASGGGKVVTWGEVVSVTEAFLQHQCDEAWVVLSADELNSKGLSVAGFDLAQLNTDLDALPTAA